MATLVGADSSLVLVADRLRRASALFNVALEASFEAQLVRRIDVDAQLVKRKQLGEMECEEALDQQKGAGMYGLSQADSGGDRAPECRWRSRRRGASMG